VILLSHFAPAMDRHHAEAERFGKLRLGLPLCSKRSASSSLAAISAAPCRFFFAMNEYERTTAIEAHVKATRAPPRILFIFCASQPIYSWHSQRQWKPRVEIHHNMYRTNKKFHLTNIATGTAILALSLAQLRGQRSPAGLTKAARFEHRPGPVFAFSSNGSAFLERSAILLVCRTDQIVLS
jgi:hypothetical protein